MKLEIILLFIIIFLQGATVALIITERVVLDAALAAYKKTIKKILKSKGF